MSEAFRTIAGIILAGGEGRRIGGRKPFRPLLGRPMIEHVLDRVSPQVSKLWLSARGNAEQLAQFELPVLEDRPGPGGGPLAGIVAGLDAAAAEGFEALAVFACDVPFLPDGLVARLTRALSSAGASGVVVSVSGRLQPTIGLWRTDARGALAAELNAGRCKLELVCADLGAIALEEPQLWGNVEAYLNVNTSDDLAAAERAGCGSGGWQQNDRAKRKWKVGASRR